jgi:O-methyltransferase
MSSILDLMGPSGINAAAELALQWYKHRGRGDYLEFGTFRGRSLTAFFRAAENHNVTDMRFFGFDSFEGLPETPTCRPRTPASRPGAFVAGNYKCSQEELRGILTENCLDMTRVTLIPGFYSDSLTELQKAELPIEAAGIVNIDCDIYESTVHVLSFITGYLRTGTLLLFDDWLAYAHPFRGEAKACHEWLLDNPQIQLTEYFKYTETGVAFIVSVLNQNDQDQARCKLAERVSVHDVPTRLRRALRVVGGHRR